MNDKFTIKTTVKTINLRCKNCGSQSINQYLPKEYNNSEAEVNKTIKYDIVSEKECCPVCKCNLFEAELGLKIE